MLIVLKRILLFALGIAVLGLAGITVLGFFGDGIAGHFGHKLDLLSHFRLQYGYLQLGLSLLLLLITLGGRSRFALLLLMVNLIFLGVNALQIVPYYIPQAPVNATQISGRVRLLHMNVLGTHHPVDRVIKVIKDTNADIISLQEYNQWWQAKLDHSSALKPYLYHYKVGDDGIYSKLPITHFQVDYLPETGKKDTTLLATFKLGKENVTLLMSHPPTPMHADLYQRQRAHFLQWGQNRKHYGDNLILVGDLNMSPWSTMFRRLLQETQLKDTQVGFGLQPSYPAFNTFKRIPIDHCLVSPRFVVLNRHLGPYTGSDHLPVIVELGMKAMLK